MRFRALVIDDYPPCRDLLHHILGARGYEVSCFAGADFCEVCFSSTACCTRENPCADFLLIDNRMPGISGLELLYLQKKGGCKIASANKAILSCAWSPLDYNRAQSFGCRIFQKPYKWEEIFSWLDKQENVLRKRALPKENRAKNRTRLNGTGERH